MAETSKRRAAWGKGGLYRRHVYETDPATGQVALDRRGQRISKYDYWQATFEVPAEDLPEGVTRRRITGNGTSQTAALRALRENIDAFYARKRSGEPLYRVPRKRGAVRLTVNDLFDEWLKHKADEAVSTTVLRKYRGMYEQHIKNEIGGVFLDKITSAQLNQLLNSTLLGKRKTGHDGRPIPGTQLLSAYARLNIWKVLRMCFLWGQRTDRFAGRSNPMMLVRMPKVTKRAIDIDARVKDADIVLRHLHENRPELLCQMGFQLLGLRQSERLGLRTSDVWGLGTDHPKLTVRGQLARHETEDIESLGLPRWYWKDKTKTGVERTIPLAEPFLTYLTDHLQRREANSKKPGYKQWDDPNLASLLFLTERGNIIEKSRDGATWKQVCKEAGVEPFPQHINRFVTAAKLAELDPPVPANVVRAILGHESEAIGYYYQRVTSANSEAALGRYGRTYGRT
jgi:integrase